MEYDVMMVVLVLMVSVYLLTSSLAKINLQYLTEIQNAKIKLQLEESLLNNYITGNFTDNYEIVAFNYIDGDIRITVVHKPSLVSNSITMFIILDNGTLIRIRL